MIVLILPICDYTLLRKLGGGNCPRRDKSCLRSFRHCLAYSSKTSSPFPFVVVSPHCLKLHLRSLCCCLASSSPFPFVVSPHRLKPCLHSLSLLSRHIVSSLVSVPFRPLSRLRVSVHFRCGLVSVLFRHCLASSRESLSPLHFVMVSPPSLSSIPSLSRLLISGLVSVPSRHCLASSSQALSSFRLFAKFRVNSFIFISWFR